jgi:hypothetical protein
MFDFGLVAPTSSHPTQPLFSRWYNTDKRCEYHGGVSGHSIENCKKINFQVQKLVSKGHIEFVKNDGIYHIVILIFSNNQ